MSDSFLRTLENIQQTSDNNSWSVFCLYGAAPSPTFFEWYRSALKQRGASLNVTDLQVQPYSQLVAELSMSFLGEAKVFFLGDLTELDASKKKEWATFLKSYKGPHKVVVFADQPIIPEYSLEMPTHLDRERAKSLLVAFQLHEHSSDMLDIIFDLQTTIPLEAFCQMMRYAPVIGHIEKNSLKTYLNVLIEPDYSLFVLSQHFFARERIAFNEFWQGVHSRFPQEFWVAFFSEQLWQASLFIKQAAQHGPLAGRKGVTRLPFSFMQRDWKNYTARELCAAHNFLYTVDYGSKNGYASYGLDLFIIHWFCRTFAKK